MRGRVVKISWPRGLSAAALHELYRNEADPAMRSRLHSLWRLREGDRLVDVALAVGFAYRTVQEWLTLFRRKGLAGLRPTVPEPHGFQSPLSPEQWDQVRDHLRMGTTRTAVLLAEWIDQQFGVRYTPRGLRIALHQRRIRIKVPRPAHVKADPDAQKAWKKGGSPKPSRPQPWHAPPRL